MCSHARSRARSRGHNIANAPDSLPPSTEIMRGRWTKRLLPLMLLAVAGCDGNVGVHGRVLDATGEAVAGGEVRLGHPGESFSFEGETDAEGCFAVGGMVGPGQRDYVLIVSAAGHVPIMDTFTSSGEYPVLIHLAAEAPGGESELKRLPEGTAPPELEQCVF